MAVLVSAEVPGMAPDRYDPMFAALADRLKQAKGFIAHAAGMSDGVWRVMELWETAEDATKWFAENVQPNLPAGITPKRTLIELHNLVTR